MSNKPTPPPRPQRQPPTLVLVKVHADGFFTVNGDNLDVCIAYVPDAAGNEILAEDTAELLTPLRFRKLFGDGKVRAQGIFRKMKPTALLQARRVARAIAALNNLGGGKR